MLGESFRSVLPRCLLRTCLFLKKKHTKKSADESTIFVTFHSQLFVSTKDHNPHTHDTEIIFKKDLQSLPISQQRGMINVVMKYESCTL